MQRGRVWLAVIALGCVLAVPTGVDLHKKLSALEQQQLLQAIAPAKVDSNSPFAQNYFTIEQHFGVEAVKCSTCPAGKHVVKQCDLLQDTVCGDDECVSGEQDAYNFSKCQTLMTPDKCKVSCAQGYEQIGQEGPAVVCSGNHGKFIASGCQDANECATRPCGNHAECINLIGSFECQCNTGYTGKPPSNACTPQCATFDCPVGYSKTNDDRDCGAEGCSVPLCCQDVNECESNTNPCAKAFTKCVNTLGSYQCDCEDGYYLFSDGVCLPTCATYQKCPTGYNPKPDPQSKRCPTTSCTAERCCDATCATHTCSGQAQSPDSMCPGGNCELCCFAEKVQCVPPQMLYYSCPLTNQATPEANAAVVESQFQDGVNAKGFCSTASMPYMTSNHRPLCRSRSFTEIGQRFSIVISEPSESAQWKFLLHIDTTWGVVVNFDGVTHTTIKPQSPPADGLTLTFEDVLQGPHTLVVYAAQNNPLTYATYVVDWKFSRNEGEFLSVNLANLHAVCEV